MLSAVLLLTALAGPPAASPASVLPAEAEALPGNGQLVAEDASTVALLSLGGAGGALVAAVPVVLLASVPAAGFGVIMVAFLGALNSFSNDPQYPVTTLAWVFMFGFGVVMVALAPFVLGAALVGDSLGVFASAVALTWSLRRATELTVVSLLGVLPALALWATGAGLVVAALALNASPQMRNPLVIGAGAAFVASAVYGGLDALLMRPVWLTAVLFLDDQAAPAPRRGAERLIRAAWSMAWKPEQDADGPVSGKQ